MRVVIGTEALEPVDVDLTITDAEATVGDLLTALDEGGDHGVVLDGRFCHSDLALDEIGMYEGATIVPGGPPQDVDAPAAAALELRVVGGLDAGRWMPLRAGTAVSVGRDPGADLRLTDAGVSRHHLELRAGATGGVTITDLDSANGTWVEGRRIDSTVDLLPGTIFEAGDVALTIATTPPPLPFDPLRQVTLAGTVAFNRPPRLRAPDRPPPLVVPEKPREAERPRLSLVSAIGPLLLGVVMVIVLKNILFALFMLLSPFLVVGGWLEQRRTANKTARGEGREHTRELERFRTELRGRRAEELTRRREALPDPAELIRRASAPDPRLWERRPHDTDFMILSGGFAKLLFQPELKQRSAPAEGAEQALKALERLPPAPAEIDLSGGGVVGVVGPRPEALALARSLVCQAATLHGPADLQITVATDAGAESAWDFVKWLPHARDHLSGGSKRLLAFDPAGAETLVASLRDRSESDPRTVLAVLDSPGLIEGRGAVGRALLRGGEQVSGIVIASSAERLPASCTTVIQMFDGTAEVTLRRPQQGELIDPLLATGVSITTARSCALALARFEDADLELEGGTLPIQVALLDLINMSDPNPVTIGERWRAAAAVGDFTATFALDQDGPFAIDLVRDGPHGLIAGTTGAGKSELLRSLVAALAAEHGPDRLNFVLIDYKGGSAFARCADLPHTVGMVTDLDEQLGERALESLEAELRYRERMLREAGADDLVALSRLTAAGRADPMPRLLVIIDEFATLAGELPDFIASLVGIAQRGRSLGVHLLLATQRPSGAVSENIRANTNLRICLRVQANQDSIDVIDSPAASHISRSQPGRAFVRLGPSDLDPIQTALVTGTTESGGSTRVKVADFTFEAAAITVPGGQDDGQQAHDQNDLDRLVGAAVEAAAQVPAPRRPWLEPLPASLSLERLLEVTATHPASPFAGNQGLGSVTAPIALIDDPRAQAQYAAGWNLAAGNLLMFGIGGSGTTTAMQTIALALAATNSPEELHIYALDFGAGELAPLAGLPHVGGVVAASERERQTRLIRRLRAEMAARRDASSRTGPRIVLLLDGYAAFVSEHSDIAGDAVREELGRVWADGPEVGIHIAISGDRPGAVPTALASLAQQRLILQLADTSDYAQFGLNRRSIPRFGPGRAVLVGSNPKVLQLARSQAPLAQAVAAAAERWGTPASAPAPIGVLPDRVAASALLARPIGGDPEAVWLPVAIDDESLGPAGWELYPGEHALICGPSRSGRSNALRVLAEVSRALYPELAVYVAAVRRSSVVDLPGLVGRARTAAELAELVATLREAGGPALLLIDDADAVDDQTRALTELIANPDSGVHVVAAGRAEALRMLGHWSAGIRGSRNGLLLSPDLNIDGALFGVALPRRPPPPSRPGCGYLIRSGALVLAQAALADPT
jgi:DNA segregation ATPase FtsK/SpoIIIE, S-DNA-T family